MRTYDTITDTKNKYELLWIKFYGETGFEGGLSSYISYQFGYDQSRKAFKNRLL